VSVTALASTTYALKAKVRYQQKALDAGNKMNIGIELKILDSKVMTVTCILAYHEIFTWRLWQEIDASSSLALLEED